MEPKVCAFALGHLNHQLLNNRLSACFRCSEKLGDYREQKMSEVMNSFLARKHRKTLMAGEWPTGCGSCRDYEAQGQPSSREVSFKHLDINSVLKNYNPDTGEISHLESIEIRFGNECNLSCRHCNSVHSSKWEAIINRDPSLLSQMHREPEEKGGQPVEGYFEDILQNVVPGLKEILFAGGETLYQKAHYNFVDSIPLEHAKHIKLLYVTNGSIQTLKGWNLTEIWHRFEEVRIIISTDGVGERYNYFRVGANWQQVEQNIRYWMQEGFSVVSEVTCSVFQMFYLIESLEYLYENKLGKNVSTSIVQYPPVLNPRVIDIESKLMIKKEWEEHLDKITDLDKKMAFLNAGQHIIDYMMGDELNIYSLPNNHIPNWSDFEQAARTMDRLFKTDIEKSFPKIASTFIKNNTQEQRIESNNSIL